MKRFGLVLSLLVVIGCKENSVSTSSRSTSVEVRSPLKVVQQEFQKILDSADVLGSIVVYDLKEDTYYSNDFEWAKVGRLPASTFKIPNSIIALETGVVEDDSTLFEWDGNPRRLAVWEQDLIFEEAFHKSCVPCYQEIARAIGVQRMQQHVNKFNYGKMVVNDTTIDDFWLIGASEISQMQQIEFLKRFYTSELPISKRTHDIMYDLMEIEAKTAYRMSGKTGWAIRDGQNNGWFVGYLEKENNTYFFAVNIDPKESFNMDLFAVIRKDLASKAFRQMRIID